jgi:mono/diheme cytochrome c family protein
LFLVACVIGVSSVALYGSKSQDAARAGGLLFRDKGCAYCHGDRAQGTNKAPSLADTRRELKAAQIASQIEDGGQKMPSFKDSLSQDEVAQLVAFLRAKHKPFAPPASTPAQVPGSVSNPVQ